MALLLLYIVTMVVVIFLWVAVVYIVLKHNKNNPKYKGFLNPDSVKWED